MTDELDLKKLPSQRRGPYHRLQETVNRFELHSRLLAEHGTPAEETEELRQLGERFTHHFIQFDRLRSRLAQLVEKWEQP